VTDASDCACGLKGSKTDVNRDWDVQTKKLPQVNASKRGITEAAITNMRRFQFCLKSALHHGRATKNSFNSSEAR
jgi:hypothetical protein